MDIKNFLPELCLKSGSEAFETAKSALSEFAEVKDSPLSNIYGVMKGSSDYSILLDAHIDEVHFIVTSVDKDGFLLVDKFGGPGHTSGCRAPSYGAWCKCSLRGGLQI